VANRRQREWSVRAGSGGGSRWVLLSLGNQDYGVIMISERRESQDTDLPPCSRGGEVRNAGGTVHGAPDPY